jgi:hypothetical protein
MGKYKKAELSKDIPVPVVKHLRKWRFDSWGLLLRVQALSLKNNHAILRNVSTYGQVTFPRISICCCCQRQHFMLIKTVFSASSESFLFIASLVVGVGGGVGLSLYSICLALRHRRN